MLIQAISNCATNHVVAFCARLCVFYHYPNDDFVLKLLNDDSHRWEILFEMDAHNKLIAFYFRINVINSMIWAR